MESCKICIYDPKASESCFFKYIKLGLFPTDTAPCMLVSLVTKPSSLITGIYHKVETTVLVNHIQKVSRKSSWKANGTWLFRSFQLKKTSVTTRISKKITFCVPNVPNRNSCSISSNSPLIPVAGFHRLFFGKMDLICANGERDSRTKFASPEFCLPFAQTVKSISVCPFILVNNPLYLSSLHQRKVPWSKENNTFTQWLNLYLTLLFSLSIITLLKNIWQLK